MKFRVFSRMPSFDYAIFAAMIVWAGLAQTAQAGALSAPYPRSLNWDGLTRLDSSVGAGALANYSGAMAGIDSPASEARADEFKQLYGETKALFARVEWQGKNPLETTTTITGPALDSLGAAMFLHYPGTKVTRRVGRTSTEIPVMALSAFAVGDAAALIPPRTMTGNPPDYTSTLMERVIIDALNPSGYGGLPTLEVRRAQFGTTAVDVTAGYYVLPIAQAAHAPVWRWNLSYNAPLDSQLRIGYARVAEWTGDWLVSRHPAWDGLFLANSRWNVDSGALGNAASPARGPDANGDAAATADWGYADGVNQFGLGQAACVEAMRAKTGDSKAILIGFGAEAGGGGGADSLSPWPGPAGGAGLAIERFPEGAPGGDVDSALEWLRFWSEKTPAGVLWAGWIQTEADTRAYGGGESNAAFRIGLAAACLTNSWHAYTAPSAAAATYAWDEYVGGADGAGVGWLGYPVEAAQRNVSSMTRAVSDIPVSGWSLAVAQGNGAAALGPYKDEDEYATLPDGVSVRVEVTGVASPIPALGDIVLRSQALGALAAGSYTIHFRAKTKFTDDVPPPAREIEAGLACGTGAAYMRAGRAPLGDSWREYYLSVTLPEAASAVRLEFRMGGPKGSVWVDDFELLQGEAERYSRRFQNGIVLLNATGAPWYVSLPGRYRALTGGKTPAEDPGVNDGQTGLIAIEVPAHDARILAIDQTGPTPTAIPSPSPIPSVSPTAAPSPTMVIPPTETPRPTYTPQPTYTPYPTSSPYPSVSPTPLPEEARRTINGLLGRLTLSSSEWAALDHNQDVSVDIADLVVILP